MISGLVWTYRDGNFGSCRQEGSEGVSSEDRASVEPDSTIGVKQLDLNPLSLNFLC